MLSIARLAARTGALPQYGVPPRPTGGASRSLALLGDAKALARTSATAIDAAYLQAMTAAMTAARENLSTWRGEAAPGTPLDYHRQCMAAIQAKRAERHAAVYDAFPVQSLQHHFDATTYGSFRTTRAWFRS